MWLGLASAANLGRFPVEVILNGPSLLFKVVGAPEGFNQHQFWIREVEVQQVKRLEVAVLD